jgi:cell division topological specificity factor
MFDNIINFFKKFSKEQNKDSKDTAKERLHLVLMQDRANVSADFLEMMKQEIIEVIKKYIDVDENSIDVKLTNKVNSDGTTGAPALYANIPIISLKDETKKIKIDRENNKEENKKEKSSEENENKEEHQEEKSVDNNEENQEVKQEIKEESQEVENNENIEKIEEKNENNEEKHDSEKIEA